MTPLFTSEKKLKEKAEATEKNLRIQKFKEIIIFPGSQDDFKRKYRYETEVIDFGG